MKPTLRIKNSRSIHQSIRYTDVAVDSIMLLTNSKIYVG